MSKLHLIARSSLRAWLLGSVCLALVACGGGGGGGGGGEQPGSGEGSNQDFPGNIIGQAILFTVGDGGDTGLRSGDTIRFDFDSDGQVEGFNNVDGNRITPESYAYTTTPSQAEIELLYRGASGATGTEQYTLFPDADTILTGRYEYLNPSFNPPVMSDGRYQIFSSGTENPGDDQNDDGPVDNPGPESGRLTLGNAEGLRYTQPSTNVSGVTDANGTFTYDGGAPVTVSVGNVDIATFDPADVVTAVDLAPNGSIDDQAAINRTNFLLLLNGGATANGGISVDPALSAPASDWSVRLDDGETAYEQDVTAILPDIQQVIPNAQIPNREVTRFVMAENLLCQRAGAFTGSYGGGDNGTFGFLASATTGAITGFAYSVEDDEVFPFTAIDNSALDRQGSFVSSASGGATRFTGTYLSADRIGGNWSNSAFGISGTFNGDRIGGSRDAAFRYTGAFTGASSGLFSFDINETGNVTGIAYDATEDETLPLSGTLTGSTLTVTYAQSAGAINGVINLDEGTVTGSWANSDDGSSGQFSGTGCRLNPAR